MAYKHPELTEDDIKNVFEAFGPITYCKLAYGASAHKHKGYGFLEYGLLAAALEAIASMNLFDLGGQYLRVGSAITPPNALAGRPAPAGRGGDPRAAGGGARAPAPRRAGRPAGGAATEAAVAVAGHAAAAGVAVDLGPVDVDEALHHETQEECGKWGRVQRLVIYNETQHEDDDPRDAHVNIFVQFEEAEEAAAAATGTSGAAQ